MFQESINLWYDIVTDHIDWLDIEFDNLFIKSQIKVDKILDWAGVYRISNDIIDVWIGYWLNVKVIIHETLHAFSSSNRFSSKDIISTWFYLATIQWKLCSQGFWFNEWVTEIITHRLASQRKKEIDVLTSTSTQAQRKINAMLLHNWEKVGQNSLYKTYIEEVKFTQNLIDLLCYKRIHWKDLDFWEEREKIWAEVEQAYFYWDMKWLKSICKEVDPRWLLYKHIMDLRPSKNGFWELSVWIESYIKDVFNKDHVTTV